MEILNEDTVNVPMEDISVIIVENNQVAFNSYLISQLSEYNIVMISCDDKHMPSVVSFPFHNHSRYSETAWAQTEISEPFKKRLWQTIIKAKIANQAMVLKCLQKSNADTLCELSKKVLSGDAKNTEAYAANIYWKSLFDDFTRSDEDNILNSALNYGYAVIRGCMARYIVACGLIPCFGIHHANKLNQFNLVDDMMEPYRPFVDYAVYRMDAREMNKDTKANLVKVLTTDCIIGDEELNLMKTIEITAFSLAKSIRTKSEKYLSLPVFKET